MLSFECQTKLPVSSQILFQYHARQGAFQRLAPPWETLEIINYPKSLENNSQLHFAVKKGPLRINWVAHHSEVTPNQLFVDTQLKGPFQYWRHEHHFLVQDRSNSLLLDKLEIKLPGGFAGETFGKRALGKQLERMFRFRHKRTKRDLIRHQSCKQPIRLLIVGQIPQWCHQLACFLSVGGHSVYVMDINEKNRFFFRAYFDQSPCHPLAECDAILLTDQALEPKAPAEDDETYLEFLFRALNSQFQRPQHLLRIINRDQTDPKWKSDPQIPAEMSQDEFFRWEKAQQVMDRLTQLIPNETRLHLGAVIEPNVSKMQRLLLRLETFLFLAENAQTAQFNWISRDDLLGCILFLLTQKNITGDLALIHPKPATRATLQQLILKHFFAHYAFGRMFQIVGWSPPGQSPDLNQHLLQFPSIHKWGFEFQAIDLKHAFLDEFGI